MILLEYDLNPPKEVLTTCLFSNVVNKTATAAMLQLTTNRERQVKFSFFNDQEHRRCHEHFNDVIISLATHLFEMIITHLQL